ncbi:hypothetical protein NYE59_01560 [Paenibacillus sp. FSL L8-0323]|uniref:hypothetical protein n=1 Tax=Paenibacillus sp. FSL L8-0323 TaxID=2975330 RepID=UPI0030F7B435
MTPERIESIKLAAFTREELIKLIRKQESALEESEQQNVQLSMNNLNLQTEIESVQIDNNHLRKSIDWWDNYSRDKSEELAEAQQTIARQQKKIEWFENNHMGFVDGEGKS